MTEQQISTSETKCEILRELDAIAEASEFYRDVPSLPCWISDHSAEEDEFEGIAVLGER